MDAVSVPLAVTLVVIGALALTAATFVAVRDPLPARSRGVGRLGFLVPWVGSALVVALLVRGSLAGAGFVGLATLVYVGWVRARAVWGGGDAGGSTRGGTR